MLYHIMRMTNVKIIRWILEVCRHVSGLVACYRTYGVFSAGSSVRRAIPLISLDVRSLTGCRVLVLPLAVSGGAK